MMDCSGALEPHEIVQVCTSRVLRSSLSRTMSRTIVHSASTEMFGTLISLSLKIGEAVGRRIRDEAHLLPSCIMLPIRNCIRIYLRRTYENRLPEFLRDVVYLF